MNGLFDVLSAIADAIVGVFDFIISFIQDLLYIVQLIGTILVQIPSFFSWLPSELTTIIVVGITVAAVYKIAGRD